MEEQEDNYNEVEELSEEQQEEIIKVLRANKKPKSLSKQQKERNLLKDNILFMVGLLSSGIKDGNSYELIIKDDAYSREQLVKDIMILTKKLINT